MSICATHEKELTEFRDQVQIDVEESANQRREREHYYDIALQDIHERHEAEGDRVLVSLANVVLLTGIVFLNCSMGESVCVFCKK